MMRVSRLLRCAWPAVVLALTLGARAQAPDPEDFPDEPGVPGLPAGADLTGTVTD